jgi:hemoglobin
MADIPTEEPSHFDRLGGTDTITAAVDEFYDRVLNDPELAFYFSGVDIGRLKRHQVLLFSQLLGGPEGYNGRTLEVAHRGLGITDAHFDRVAEHLIGTLRDAGAPDDTIAAVGATVGGVRGDIVGDGAAGGAGA